MPLETRNIKINFEFELEPVAKVSLLEVGQGFAYDGEIPRGGGVYLFQFFNPLPDGTLRPGAWYVGQSGDLRGRLNDYETASKVVGGKGTTWRIADEIVQHLKSDSGAVCVLTATYADFSGSRFEEDNSLNTAYRRLMVEGGLIAQLEEEIQHGSQERLNRTRSRRSRHLEKIVIVFPPDGTDIVELEEEGATGS